MRLPKKFHTLHDHQIAAIEQVVEAYRDGYHVVLMDAPTGSGKTVIGEAVRQVLDTTGLYVCTTKGLQDQFLRDFDYARVLKGRANYPTEYGEWPTVTAADCTGGEACFWCDTRESCPYQIAKDEALAADVAVLNTAYLLAEANSPRGKFGANGMRPPFIIADECDELEGSLMGAVEWTSIGSRELRELRLTTPKKGSHRGTIVKWLRDVYVPVLEKAGRETYKIGKSTHNVQLIRKGTRWIRNAADAAWVAGELAPATEEDGEVAAEEAGAMWVRDYRKNDPERLVFKPVVVDRYGPTKLWRHGRRWLCMSATIISPQEQAESLGLDQSGLRWASVEVPMTFPVENRPIYVAGVAKVTKKAMDAEGSDVLERLSGAIGAICVRHPGERILVHTVAYKLADELKWRLDNLVTDRLILTYGNAAERDDAFERYARTPGAVLLAPSMDRGFDFRGDLARVVVIAKVPFPNLGDRQVSARLRLPERDGDWWYRVQTVRTIVQMTGRGVRGADDWAATYILDQEFQNNIYRKAKSLFPKWWRDALDQTFSVRHLMRDVPTRDDAVVF